MGQTLRIGIITAYLDEDWHSQQLFQSAGRFGKAVVIRPESLGARLTKQGVSVVSQDIDLQSIDGFILARGFGERGNSDFLVPVYQILERNGAILVNNIDAVLTAIDKFETSYRLQQAGIPTPAVVVAQEESMARNVLNAWGRMVMKPLFGSLGLGVELVDDTPEGRSMLPEYLEYYGAIYLQEYVPNPGRDIRAFVVGDRVVASMYRIAIPGNWRTNVYQGAQTEPCILDAYTQDIAIAAAKAIGLDYTGIDILEGPDGPIVLEVNGNPLWRGLLEATKQNVADDIVEWVVSRITRTTTKGGERVA
ncbi:MAG TPA: RimK family alpha-L-glutamate ligase [Armatimonadota bacterium]|nr:RimK family alpha-L-glutamate ligase [Armatimonadota bacterium]